VLRNGQYKIGGAEDAIQMDETHISKRKQNVGRTLCHYWIIGGISENTGDIFLVSSIKRTEKIMQRIICDRVTEETLIKTDGWRSYKWLDRSRLYKHQIVNHKEHFVNPVDGTHTQKIERLWLEIKELKRRRRGFKIDSLDMYMNEFIWRQNYLKKAENKFMAIMDLVKDYA
jgi:transposase-like protein